jgi:SPP1 gp7 family putative phage head morphogenesis protein
LARPDLAKQVQLRRALVAASAKRNVRAKAPVAAPPLGEADDYTRELEALLAPVEAAALKALEKIIPTIVSLRTDSAERLDDTSSQIITRTMSQIRIAYAQRVSAARIEQIAARAGVDTSKQNRREINRQFRSVLGIDLPGTDPFLATQLDAFRKMNVGLVTNMTTEQLDKLEATLRAAAASGSRVETIRADVQARFGVSRSRAALIARDQVLKLNGELTQLRHREAGITEYEWITSGDEAVRERHSELGAMSESGTVFKYSEPPIVDVRTGRRANPGEDFQCRCTANPIIRL